ncbi:MAG TPA: biopolymer transporter ExbD [Kofleriaceae bacterium]|nr:biopolymer transporter ExbD [Kofleriaceae bacterium]
MGASIDTGGNKKSFDVELNIVPFIDLMSCLTAFLLVTAVWVNIAQITITPKGKQRPDVQPPDTPLPVISVLLQPDVVYIGVGRTDKAFPVTQAKKEPGGDYDWTTFETDLGKLKGEEDFAERGDIEIAAESTNPEHPVKYDDIIHAMDLAVKVGFTQVNLSEPSSLSWRPTL